MQDYSDDEIEGLMVHKLFRRRCIGSRYMPTTTLVKWITAKVKREGVRINQIVDGMVKGGYSIKGKSGKVISINSRMIKEAQELRKRFITSLNGKWRKR